MNEDLATWRRVVFPDEAGERLDRFLAAATEMSRRAIRRWVAERSCRVNGGTTGRLGRELRAGDVVELPMPEAGLPSADRVPAVVTILHEDDWLLALDKPAGILSQPIPPVRVHLAHLGYPVVGDGLYGADSRIALRPLLHAASLRLPHPRDGRELEVAAPEPDDFS